MTKLESVVIEYEFWRQEVWMLDRKRCDLIQDCRAMKELDFNTATDWPDICLKEVHKELIQTIKNNPYEGYSYVEILDNMHCEGKVCDSCYSAYQLKIGDLARARERFGHAKRSLSRKAKVLLGAARND